MFPHEQRVAAPAEAMRYVRLGEKTHAGFMVKRGRIEKSATAAETTIDLLKGDDVSVELPDHTDYAIRPRCPVDPPALVDVVRCNLHGNLNSNGL